MSKYRVGIQPSRFPQRFIIAGAMVCIVSLLLWPTFHPLQIAIQSLIILLVLIQATHLSRRIRQNHNYSTVILNDDGDWLDTTCQRQWRISSASRCTPVVVYVSLLDLHASTKKAVWVFRDAVDEVSFRRISRVVHKLQRDGSG